MSKSILVPIWTSLLCVGCIAFADRSDPIDLEASSKHDTVLKLGGASFDPLFDRSPFPVGLAKSAPDKPDLRLVQLHGPVRDAHRASLQERGIVPIQYIHPNTYVVWADPDQLEATSTMRDVRWAGDFAPACRLLPHLRGRTDERMELRVVVYGGADIESIVRTLHDMGIDSVKRRSIDATFDVIGCAASGSNLEQIASLPGVYTVQPQPTGGGDRGEMANQLNTSLYDIGTIQPGYYDWLTNLGITGVGTTIACVDSGIHEAAPDLVNRMAPCTGDSCGDSETSSSHGTLVAGLLAGDGASEVVDNWGYLAGQGMAPRSMMLEQVYDPTYTEPDGMLQLMTDSWDNGARISNNSWGPHPTPLGYDIDTRLVDVGVRDAAPDLSGNQQLPYVLSIMNGNGGTSTQGTPDEAMNVIRVGASRLRSSGGAIQNRLEDIASNSAHGPCLDGRMLPDLVAPGCQVLSVYDVNNWAYTCGTSMAAPQVSGAASLFTEFFRTNVGVGRNPSPAMIKAALIVAAKGLAGGEDADGYAMGHPPDSKQGWGRLGISELIDPELGGVRYFDQNTVFGDSGEEWALNIEAHDPAKPVRIALVWTTAPGHGLGGTTPAWTNDLDLLVESDGSTHYGNDIDPTTGWSNADGVRDGMNNSEMVVLDAGSSYATIRVQATNINSDGLPGFGDSTDQDFALVCWNCSADPFTVVVSPAAIEVCAPGTVQYSVEIQSPDSDGTPVVLNAFGPLDMEFELQDTIVVPPAKTVLSVQVASGTSGIQSFSVTGASGGYQTEATAEIVVVNAFLSVPDLLEPYDGEEDISTLPTLAWDMSEATSYALEIATDDGFKDIAYSTVTSQMEHTVDFALQYGSDYFWRVRPSNACGLGQWSQTYSFATSPGLKVLLIDDDDNEPDVRSYYTGPLGELGIEYVVWDTLNTDDEPTLETYRDFDLVIWFTGAEWGGFAGPGEASEATLATWLDEGGVLWMSSQDYLYDRGLTDFGTDYLGVADYDSDVGQLSVTGAGSVFGGYGTMTITCPFPNYTDSLEAGAIAEVGFNGEEGPIGLTVLDQDWRTVFWAFPFEAVLDDSVRRSLMLSVLNWVPVPEPSTCSADVVPDGFVNIQDLLLVIAQWAGPGPDADVTADGVVDVSDLLIVISMWGPCG
ncbi:MAG: hypothetical protein CMJ24_03325 [Phycisphaerae bacterium]|nr:hypothetical protein [Phycisphaerae bacterium]